MQRSTHCFALLALLFGGMFGCQSRMVAANNPIPITAEEYDRIFEASVDVLRLNQFVVERQDRRFGVITTEPRVAASMLEPWWTDNTTAYQHADATMNYQRRIVKVHLEPADAEALAAAELARVDVRRGEAEPEATLDDIEPSTEIETDADPPSVTAPTPISGYQLRVEVMLEQRQLPEQQLHTAVMGTVSYYGRSPDVRATVTEEGREESFWRPVGRDPYFEQRLVKAILDRATFVIPQTTSEEGPTDDDASNTPDLIRPTDPDDSTESPEQP